MSGIRGSKIAAKNIGIQIEKKTNRKKKRKLKIRDYYQLKIHIIFPISITLPISNHLAILSHRFTLYKYFQQTNHSPFAPSMTTWLINHKLSLRKDKLLMHVLETVLSRLLSSQLILRLLVLQILGSVLEDTSELHIVKHRVLNGGLSVHLVNLGGRKFESKIT